MPPESGLRRPSPPAEGNLARFQQWAICFLKCVSTHIVFDLVIPQDFVHTAVPSRTAPKSVDSSG